MAQTEGVSRAASATAAVLSSSLPLGGDGGAGGGDGRDHAAAPTFTDIYAAQVRWVWRALWRLGVPERDLEDVAHDVFVVVHRKLADYDPGRPLRPWLFGICFRTALDRRRKHATTREEPTAQAAQAADTAVDADVIDGFALVHRQQQQALVQAALSTLPLEQRAVLVLHELEGVAVADCVAVLEAPLNTLYSRLRLARLAFARAVARLGGSPR